MKTHWTQNLPELEEDMLRMQRTLQALKDKRGRLRQQLDGTEDSIRQLESALLHTAKARYSQSEVLNAMFPEYEDRPMSIEPNQIG